MIDRQKLVGWVLVVVSAAFIVYFLKVRMFEPGPPLEKKEWVQFIGSFITLMLGTMNVRIAARRTFMVPSISVMKEPMNCTHSFFSNGGPGSNMRTFRKYTMNAADTTTNTHPTSFCRSIIGPECHDR